MYSRKIVWKGNICAQKFTKSHHYFFLSKIHQIKENLKTFDFIKKAYFYLSFRLIKANNDKRFSQKANNTSKNNLKIEMIIDQF